MYIIDDIAYAGEIEKPAEVRGVRVLPEYRLWLRFSTGEAKIFDFKPLLDLPAFTPLKDPEVFAGVYIDHGVTVWNDGEIDIGPDTLYEESVSAEGNRPA